MDPYPASEKPESNHIHPTFINFEKRSITIKAPGFPQMFTEPGMSCEMRCLAQSFAEFYNFSKYHEIHENSCKAQILEFLIIHMSKKESNIAFPKWVDFFRTFSKSAHMIAAFVKRASLLTCKHYGKPTSWNRLSLIAQNFTCNILQQWRWFPGGEGSLWKSTFCARGGAQFKLSVVGVIWCG